MLTHAARLCLCWSGETGGVAMCSCSATWTAARLNRFSTTESRSRLRRQPRRPYRSGAGGVDGFVREELGLSCCARLNAWFS